MKILNKFKEEKKELKLKYDYGFSLINGFAIEVNQKGISQNNNFNDKREFSNTKTFKGHKEKIVSLIQLSSGKLASGSYDNTIRIWDMNSLKENRIIKEKGKVFALLEFENGKLLSGTSENSINLWDIHDSPFLIENSLFSFTGHELWINFLFLKKNSYFILKIKIYNILIAR